MVSSLIVLFEAARVKSEPQDYKTNKYLDSKISSIYFIGNIFFSGKFSAISVIRLGAGKLPGSPIFMVRENYEKI